MALWVCLQCSTAYAVGLEACPHCGGTSFRPDWEEDMGKINSAGEATTPDSMAALATEGGEQPSQDPGGASTRSGSTAGKSSKPSSPGPRSPAPTTENPSSTDPQPTPDPGSSSTAGTTDGPTPGTGSARKGPDLRDLLG